MKFSIITTDKRIRILAWSVFSIIILLFTMFFIYIATFPTITLENDVIRISGRYGGDFNISNIESIDTVRIYPKVGSMRGGSSGFLDSYIGNFGLANEVRTAKLYIYRNNPPYIKIRMNDNSLLIFNFKKQPDKTVEFYNQLQNTLKKNETNQLTIKKQQQ